MLGFVYRFDGESSTSKRHFFLNFHLLGIQRVYASAYRLYLDDFSDFLPAIYLILPAIYLCTESDDKGHSVHASSCPCYDTLEVGCMAHFWG